MKSSGNRLVLVPSAGQRALGWGSLLLGIAALVVGMRAGSALGTSGLAVALVALGLGADIVLTRFVVTPEGVQVRRLLPASASATEITAVEPRRAWGLLGDKVRIEIDRNDGRPIKLSRLQRYATPEGLASTATDVAAIRQILGGLGAERPRF